jgi:hypothetical protein
MAIQDVVAEEAREYANSVKADDITTGKAYHFIMPFPGGMGGGEYRVLPRELPGRNRYAYQTARDGIAFSTTRHAPQWGNAVTIAVAKAASRGWDIQSGVELRRKRWHALLMNSSASPAFYGPTHFLEAHTRSYLLGGRAVFEVERERNPYMSRVVAIHHLSPMRCVLTDDPQTPVLYLDKKGVTHGMRYYDVGIVGDGVDATDGDALAGGMQFEEATARAYPKIILDAVINNYLYEKVSGSRPQIIYLIKGILDKTVTDAVNSAKESNAMKGLYAFMGAVVHGVPGDTPLDMVEIPLASLPDGFDPQQLRDEINLVYCAAVGLDPNEIDPRLATARNLGSGGQSAVLNEKMSGKGLRAWEEKFEDCINYVVADAATRFYFRERSTDDDLKLAQLKLARAQARKAMIDAGEITSEISRQMAVDDGDLDPRYLPESDKTPQTIIGDDDKPMDESLELESGFKPQVELPIAPPGTQPAQPEGEEEPEDGEEAEKPKKGQEEEPKKEPEKTPTGGAKKPPERKPIRQPSK